MTTFSYQCWYMVLEFYRSVFILVSKYECGTAQWSLNSFIVKFLQQVCLLKKILKYWSYKIHSSIAICSTELYQVKSSFLLRSSFLGDLRQLICYISCFLHWTYILNMNQFFYFGTSYWSVHLGQIAIVLGIHLLLSLSLSFFLPGCYFQEQRKKNGRSFDFPLFS